MPNNVLLEEFQITMTSRRSVPEEERDQIRAVLNSRAFRNALRLTIREVMRQFPALEPVRIAVTT